MRLFEGSNEGFQGRPKNTVAMMIRTNANTLISKNQDPDRTMTKVYHVTPDIHSIGIAGTQAS